MWKLLTIFCYICIVAGNSIVNVHATDLNITQKSVMQTNTTTITTTVTTPLTKHNNNANNDDVNVENNDDATTRTIGTTSAIAAAPLVKALDVDSTMDAAADLTASGTPPSIVTTSSSNDIPKHNSKIDDNNADNNNNHNDNDDDHNAADTIKGKRQTKDTKIVGDFSNHRTQANHDDAIIDDLENGQETVYTINPRQYLIRQRPQTSTHQQQQIIDDIVQQQQQEQQQQQTQQTSATQLRNYPVTIRPHNTQLLEQSQEIQHFAYLQDLAGRQTKTYSSKNGLPNQSKKSTTIATRIQSGSPTSNEAVDEAEQRYAVAVEQPILTQARLRHYQPLFTIQYAGNQQKQQLQHSQQQQQQQHQQQQQPHLQEQPELQAQVQIQPLQIIPEEQFLKILEAELKARALQEDQYRRQEGANANALAASEKVQQSVQAQSLGSYGQKSEGEREYLQYVTGAKANNGGPRYLPLSQAPPPSSQHLSDIENVPSRIPPQIAYYQPQISYKTLPNHPLAKSSLEKEIEKLLANNKPQNTPIQIFDSTNEPSALINQHHQPIVSVPRQNTPRKFFGSNQPFAPALYQYNNYHVPIPQEVIDAKKLGPVVYPAQQQQQQQSQSQQQQQQQHHQQQQQSHSGQTANLPVQISQFFYQEPTVSPSLTRPKSHRTKYGAKLITTATPSQKLALKNELNYPAGNKYAQPIFYELDKPAPTTAATTPTHFYPSPPDPSRSIIAHPTTTTTINEYSPVPNKFRQFSLPVSQPSLSSIFVSQGTGIATSSKIVQPQQQQQSIKQKTIEDLKQLHLPQPGNGKPLTQAEFQALVDAGYPVTAVPIPIPVPYEQYIKDHPEFRNQQLPAPPPLPANYQQLMHFAQLQQHHVHPQHQQQHQRQHAQYSATRSYIARPSEPSVKIISSPPPAESSSSSSSSSSNQSLPYLKTAGAEQKTRRPRDENETNIAGVNKEMKNKTKVNKNNDKDELKDK